MKLKVAWIYPVNKKDGISIYAQRYVDAFRNYADISSIDTVDCCNPLLVKKQNLNTCDLIHIQYESSYFLAKRKDCFTSLCRSISKPIVVTLHEVYESDPGAFPRDSIKGTGVIRFLKETIYDYRHPRQTLFRKNIRDRFYANKIIVHYPYQKKILIDKGIFANTISILAHPVLSSPALNESNHNIDKKQPIQLGSTGFININYDYDLLFNALQRLEFSWHFTWIGGARRAEDAALLHSIKQRIEHYGWQNKFTITGWVTEQEQARRLAGLSMYLALFKHRSTSGSLLMAVAARTPIVATELPLVADLNNAANLMLAVPHSAQSVSESLAALVHNPDMQKTLRDNMYRYGQKHTYEELAKKTTQIYEDCLHENRH